MDIYQIAYTLNDLAHRYNYRIGQLQNLRKKVKPTRSKRIFSDSTIFNKDDIYAFQDGGRKETQFNIGVENDNGRPLFRYALSFSKEQNSDRAAGTI